MTQQKILRKLFLISSVIIMVAGLIFGGCTKPSPDQKTLKIGMIIWFGWSVGIDMMNGTQLLMDMINQKGGLDIGGERYKIELIAYDSNCEQTKAVSAANRLIYEDKVKYILGDVLFPESWFPIAEKNKVVSSTGAVGSAGLVPENHYTFYTCFVNCLGAQLCGWLTDSYPDKKNIAGAFMDNQGGHGAADAATKAFSTFGLKLKSIFYPPNATDLSALGTKVKTLKPDAFFAYGGGVAGDTLVYRAVWQAGYRGLRYAGGTAPVSSVKELIPAEALEGFISAAWPLEFDPPLTDQAREFKDAWIDKYGKWEGAEIIGTAAWSCLAAGLQKAGSIDTDKVAAAIGSGLKFEGPTGPAMMVSRPDLGNNRTVDSIVSLPMKKIVGLKPKLIKTITLEEQLGYWQRIYGK